MATYSINDIEKLSGIKAHTLRIWEKRYNIVQPRRTDTNIRFYLDEDLKRIMDIALLNKHGYKISKIACMCQKQMSTEIAKFACAEGGGDVTLDSLIFAATSLDEYKFNCILDHHVSDMGLELAMEEIVYPLLDKIVLMWTAGTINSVQEEFVLSAIRRKLICSINKVFHFAPTDAPRVVLYLKVPSIYELNMLHLQYVLCQEGIHVLNLGTEVGVEDVADACHIYNADLIFTSYQKSTTPKDLKNDIQDLDKGEKDVKLLISGYLPSLSQVDLPENVVKVKDIHDVKKIAISLLKK